jgi:hypothetical protein
MTALSIQPPFPIITDIDGQPLEDGYIWIGVANLPPIGNPIAVYWDAALTQPAALPVRTRGGYPVNAGTPARLYVNSDYSIQVQNKNGSVLYSSPQATERYGALIISSADISFLQAGSGAVVRTAQSKMRDVVSPEDFGAVGNGIADDSGAWNLALAQLANGGALNCKPGARYHFASQVTVTGPSRDKIAIFGYGARITTSGAISGLAITQGNSASGGVTVFGLNIDHQNNASATAGFDIYAAWYTNLVNCAVYAENNAATYATVLVRNGDPANDATGSFWTQLDNFIAYGVSDDIPYGVILRGASNATTIRGGALSGCITPIRLEPHSGQNTTPNGAVIDGVAFEVFTTAVSLFSNTGNDSIRGARITNCRAESGATFVSLDGTNTSQPPVPLWLSGNYNISSVTTYLNNPNSLYVNCWDFSITPVLEQQPQVISPIPIRIQGTDTTKDILELRTAGTGNHGLAILESDGSLLGWFRYVASGVLELAARASGILLYLSRVGGISLTSTRARNLRGERSFAGASTTVVTFGTAEADADYYVALGGRANETFWVTGQSTSGFTINSSNPTSNAVVMWILIR